MLDFQRIHFSRKRPLKGATSCAQPNCENKSFESDHQILSQCPIQGFLTVITSFFGSLKSKGRWLFRNNKLSLKIFWFQALWRPRFENKRNFWINCVCTKAFHIMTYSQGDICIHCIPKRALAFIASLQGAFASWHTPKRTLASWHTPKKTLVSWHTTKETFASWHTNEETFASWHTHKGAFTLWHTYMNICIMTYPQVDIRIMACTKGTFASWHPYKKHLHHDMPIRRHLHHKTFCISVSVRRHLHHG